MIMKMKRNNIILLLLISLMGLVGCYDDKSKLATNEIKLVEIDTTGIAVKQYVGYQELLEISPKIDDPNNSLQYEWLLTDIPNSSNSEFQLISTEDRKSVV